MEEELDALAVNQTWKIVPKTIDMNVIGSKWVYKAELKADDALERLKARLVAKGFSKVDGVDFSETLSPVVKPTTIIMVLTLATVKNWTLHQLDVKNVFLYGCLNTPIYMHQPLGYTDEHYPQHVCKLNRTLYGLKQTP
ncbi:hypothetical protein F2P56_014283 [Juglans regia]|uniref:Reverse transcriptase Ty1/copia-type domain-containing protein n=1 Tax=Juglans regia TaxID=51240 RepID=A0A833XD45_JUGRE|nr:hypothetical protein F2P56_014283 [Juglans regia]